MLSLRWGTSGQDSTSLLGMRRSAWRQAAASSPGGSGYPGIPAESPGKPTSESGQRGAGKASSRRIPPSPVTAGTPGGSKSGQGHPLARFRHRCRVSAHRGHCVGTPGVSIGADRRAARSKSHRNESEHDPDERVRLRSRAPCSGPSRGSAEPRPRGWSRRPGPGFPGERLGRGAGTAGPGHRRARDGTHPPGEEHPGPGTGGLGRRPDRPSRCGRELPVGRHRPRPDRGPRHVGPWRRGRHERADEPDPDGRPDEAGRSRRPARGGGRCGPGIRSGYGGGTGPGPGDRGRAPPDNGAAGGRPPDGRGHACVRRPPAHRGRHGPGAAGGHGGDRVGGPRSADRTVARLDRTAWGPVPPGRAAVTYGPDRRAEGGGPGSDPGGCGGRHLRRVPGKPAGGPGDGLVDAGRRPGRHRPGGLPGTRAGRRARPGRDPRRGEPGGDAGRRPARRGRDLDLDRPRRTGAGAGPGRRAGGRPRRDRSRGRLRTRPSHVRGRRPRPGVRGEGEDPAPGPVLSTDRGAG